MKKFFAMMVLAALVLAPAVVFAEPSPWTTASTYNEKAVGKFKFGFKNTFLGAVDLFQEPYAEIKNDGNVWAGIGKGLIDTVANVSGGIVHLGTFFIPLDLPLPDGGVQIQ